MPKQPAGPNESGAETTARQLHISEAVPIERIRHLQQAIEVRSGRLGAELLTNPAPWILDDIAGRLTALDCATALPSHPAVSPPATTPSLSHAIAADRARLDPQNLTLTRPDTWRSTPAPT